MASLMSGGFNVSALPEAPVIPSNVGKYDVGQSTAAMQQSLDLAERLRTLKTAQKLADINFKKQIAEHEAALQSLPARTQADISQAQGVSQQVPLQTKLLGLSAEKQGALNPYQIGAGQAGAVADISKAGAETASADTAKLLAEGTRPSDIEGGIASSKGKAAFSKLYAGALGADVGQPTAAPASPVAAPAALSGPLAGAQAPVPAPQPMATPGVSKLTTIGGVGDSAEMTADRAKFLDAGGVNKAYYNWRSGTVDTTTLGPNGPVTTSKPIPNEKLYEMKGARDQLAAAGLNIQDFSEPNGYIDVNKALDAAKAITSAPTVKSNYLNMDVQNPAQGMDPVEAVKERNKARVEAENEASAIIGPQMSRMDEAEANLRRMNQIMQAHPNMTGAWRQLGVVNKAQNIGSDIANLITKNGGDAKDKSLASDMQTFHRLSQQTIPLLMRLAPGAEAGSAQHGAAGGIGRILQSEVGWFAGRAPDDISNDVSNVEQSNHILSMLNDMRNHGQYYLDLQKDTGFFPREAEGKWREYKKANPTFDANGNPLPVAETPEQYFKRVAQDPAQAGKPVSAAKPSTGNAPAMSDMDNQALQWAKTNANDPRAVAILKHLGVQ